MFASSDGTKSASSLPSLQKLKTFISKERCHFIIVSLLITIMSNKTQLNENTQCLKGKTSMATTGGVGTTNI